MSELAEVDIGLVCLARESFSPPPGSPPSLRSPSLPRLSQLGESSPRRPGLIRSNTDSRMISSGYKMDSMPMDQEKIAALRRWISTILVVDFDLESGPKVCNIYPSLDLTPAEESNIAFSSFPDAPQTTEGSSIHSFRLRSHDQSQTWTQRRPVTEDGFLYGYSHFTQRRDSASKRGYQQRSIVIISHFAYPSLFHALLKRLGPEFLDHGNSVLEVACHNIAKWPDAVAGTTIELGFLGSVLHAEIPLNVDSQHLLPGAMVSRTSDDVIPVLLPSDEPPALVLFRACLQDMWSIWECVILCEPILVFAHSPEMTSQAIWWLRDVLRPLPLAGDFRPFFTIHDADHTTLVNPRPPQPGLLLGVTNPIFTKTCNHWPHVLSLVQVPSKDGREDITVGPPPGWASKYKRYISRDRTVMRQLEDACRGPDASRHAASAAMHRHFSARTAAVLTPLQRYLQTLIPTPTQSAQALAQISFHNHPSLLDIIDPLSSASNSPSGSPHPSPPTSPSPSPSLHELARSRGLHSSPQSRSASRGPLRMRPFSERDFLASLVAPGAPLPLPFKSAGKAREFYKRWLRSPSFGLWIARQEEIVKEVLNSQHSG